MEQEFVLTTAMEKIEDIPTRIKIIQGGTSAGKTFGIIPILIQDAMDFKNLEISIVAESYPHLRRGAVKDFLKVMNMIGRFDPKKWNKSESKYTFNTGSYIEFFSVDQESKVRGARRDILYVNEANNISFETYHQLAIRTKYDIYLDYNPTAEFWAHTELADDVDATLIKLNYLDNEALSETIVKEIEKAREKAKHSRYWANWWQVYGLGETGNLQGVVLEDWQQIKEIPKEASYIISGMDFGYTNDPTTLVDVYKYNGEYIFDEVIYEKGMSNRSIAVQSKWLEYEDEHGKAQFRKRRIVADSAEPKSIDEIAMHGVDIYGAEKGADSVIFGLQTIQKDKFWVTETSLNLIKELRNYVWAVDKKTGAKLNRPIDAWNHLIDAIRYALSDLSRGGRFKVDVR